MYSKLVKTKAKTESQFFSTFSPTTLVKTIKGSTFIDTIALEKSINASTSTKHLLRQKMINAGVEFWNEDKTIVKSPVVAISTLGGFLVNLEGEGGEIKLRLGDSLSMPANIDAICEGLEQTMGTQAFHTYMNPTKKSATELNNVAQRLGHYSSAHSVTIGFCIYGLSKKAELEFDVQRDMIYLSRMTSARTMAQDQPTLFASTKEGFKASEVILKNTIEALATFKKNGDAVEWREERNALYPLSACVSLGISASLRNYQKLMNQLKDTGKESEYRAILLLMNESLHALFPNLFKPNHSYQQQPDESTTITQKTFRE